MWVEGIQRIVCGVTEATTCHDVVYALAHATGKTGRFTLAERWRNNERLLSPQEHPLRVLAKWGEYSSDVQFILKQTGENAKSPTPGALDAKASSGTRTPDFLHNFSQGSGGNGEVGVTAANGGIRSPPSGNKSDIKKSLTFSGCQNSGEIPLREVSRQEVTTTSSPSQDQTSKESALKTGPGRDSGDVVTVSVHISTRKHKHQSPLGTNSAKNVGQRSPADASPGHPPHHQQKPPPYPDPPSYVRPNAKVGDVQRVWKDNSVSVSKNVDNNLNAKRTPQGNSVSPVGIDGSGGVSRQSFNLGMPKSRRNLLSEFNRRDLEEEFTEDAVTKTDSNSLSRTSSQGLRSTVPTKKTRERRVKMANSDQELHYHELLRLVNLQRERLETQNSELTHYDAEIMYWEEKQRESHRQIQNIEKEMCRLEFSGKDTDEEVAQLDKRHLENELEIGHQQEKTLAYELTLLRSKLANCETELLQCKNKMRTLIDDIVDEKHWRVKDDKEHEEREFQMMREIEELHKVIKEKIRDYDTKIESTEKLDKEVRKLEIVITEKKKQVEDLIREMKAANLESLSFTPNEEIHSLLEGNSHKGPGSGRKIVGSPRQLENAVPTSKNPHGVWV